MVAAAFVAHDDAASGRSKPTRNPVAGVCKHLAEIVRKLTLGGNRRADQVVVGRGTRAAARTQRASVSGRDELHVREVFD